MPVKLKIKHFDHDGIADTGTFEKAWKSDKNYHLKYIFIKRKDGAQWTDSDITIYINNDPITLDHALCATFGVDQWNALPIDEPLPEGAELKYSGTNREGVTIDIAVELILELKG